ncbi:protoporphyrinogen oxidase [Planococcus shenhongbingii]|uniref:Coproporphyrinogen III oxidase n=1 Tax=Planococcus shenhongbingii TaxID=3058398 RepID=A0ABT8NHD7_9BACL|nr:protoporphyrinogen oxidase [Planococcus sp. N017]MDN7247321.1 protoporphyrinogen oxidase [Planococcus sp. N017]
MTERTRKVAVVGGGITGLSAAYYLQKQAKEQNISLEVTLIEATHRLGGKIQTLRKNGFVIERGPDSFLARTNSINLLAKELGIDDQLIESRAGKTYVMVEDKLHPVPEGSVMGVPTAFGPFLTSNLYSWSGKIRAVGDLVLPKSPAATDQPVGPFVRRRFGTEVVENLIEPLFSGYFSGDIDRLSINATFPAFYEIEQQHRSLIFGMKKNGNILPEEFTTDKNGVFQTFQHGLETLVTALEKELSASTVLKGVKVESIENNNAKAVLTLNNDSTIIADDVIFALPHSKVQSLFEPYGLLKELKEMPATSVATVSMAFPAEAVKQYTDNAIGFVVSRNSDFAITACIASHCKWPSQTPDGKMLFKAFIGRVGDEAVVELSDKEIEKTVLADLRKSMAIEADPEFTIVSRWKEAMPQYLVGHKERIEKMRKEMKTAFPMVQMIGSSFEGYGLPSCVGQGAAAARKIIERCHVEQ